MNLAQGTATLHLNTYFKSDHLNIILDIGDTEKGVGKEEIRYGM